MLRYLLLLLFHGQIVFGCNKYNIEILYLINDSNYYRVGIQMGLPDLKIDSFKYQVANKKLQLQGKIGQNIEESANIIVVKKDKNKLKIKKRISQIRTGDSFNLSIRLSKYEYIIIESKYSQIICLHLRR